MDWNQTISWWIRNVYWWRLFLNILLKQELINELDDKMDMEKNMILLLFVIVSMLFIAGCGTTETQMGLGDRSGTGDGVGAGSGLTEEKIQLSIDACSELIEGDSCVLSTPRGDISGTCTLVEDVLRCAGSSAKGII